MNTVDPTLLEQVHLAEWQDRIHDAIDGSLSSTDAAQLHAHLAACSLCSAEYRRVIALDNKLRGEFAAVGAPSIDFDRRLFARIEQQEQDSRMLARQREIQNYQARLASIRGGWRQALRFQLGNVLGVVATMTALGVAFHALWPKTLAPVTQRVAQLNADLTQQVPASLTHTMGLSALSLSIIVGSILAAAAAIWFAKASDSRA